MDSFCVTVAFGLQEITESRKLLAKSILQF
jgi:hypothetical protein